MKLSTIFLLALGMMATACTTTDENVFTPDEALEIRDVQAIIAGTEIQSRAAVTRAAQNTVNVGRTAFVSGDTMVFARIKRTESPLEQFSYTNIRYAYGSDGWSRVKNGAPEKIYWTDGRSMHKFVGYSLPTSDYQWSADENVGEGLQDSTYTAQLGAAYTDNIDYTAGGDDVKAAVAIAAEDLLLCYSPNTQAETGGLTTVVNYTHALSCVRVVVDIKNYYANAVDTALRVKDMIIKNQPTQFTWNADDDALTVLTAGSRKGIKLWCKDGKAIGNGENKTFTFYGITTPQTDASVPFLFAVQYDPQKAETLTYKGSFSGISFKRGMCTTLYISLNHQDEKIETSVEYNDWKYVATPDIGALRKKSTFMDMKIDNDAIKIHTSCSSEDDATWLYGSNENTKDIYGNDGSAAYPFVIKSAPQLLAFAKEVNQGNLDFDGKFIRLDADITMQKTNKDTTYVWPGIGTDSRSFNGTFLGGDRYINRLGGNSLFVSLGEKAVVEQLHITTIGTIDGGGALADSNAGIVGGCKVIDDVNTTGGALVGTNSGSIHACYYTGSNDVSLVGTNSEGGIVVGCYVANEIPSSFHEVESKVTQLNKDLEKWYNENTGKYKSQFKFVHSPGNYPTVEKK